MAGLAAMFVPLALAILDEMLAYLALGHYWMFLMGTISSPWGQIRRPDSLWEESVDGLLLTNGHKSGKPVLSL